MWKERKEMRKIQAAQLNKEVNISYLLKPVNYYMLFKINGSGIHLIMHFWESIKMVIAAFKQTRKLNNVMWE